MRAAHRVVAVAITIIACQGCTQIDESCAYDAVTCKAARFAEQKVGSGPWDVVAVRELSCDRYQPLSGGFESEECWEFELIREDRPSFRKAVDIVVTTEGDFVRFGESRTITR